MAFPTVVLGAGLSGLHAAWRLQQAGQRVLLVEARKRAGGRILSLGPGAAVPHRVDLGPTWYWPELNPRMAAWVERLGLASYPQHNTGGSLMEAADGSVRRQGHTWAQQPVSMRLAGGMAKLVEGLQSQLTAAVQWLPDTRVDALHALASGGVEVHWVHGGQRQVQRAQQLVSTLPPRLLAGLEVLPAWPAQEVRDWNSTPTWMAGQAKFVAVYPRAFWREDGFSGTAMSQRGPMVEIHDASDASGAQAALFGFIGVPPAYRQRMGEAVLREQALAQLQRLFGPQAAAPLWCDLQDWSQQPLTATALDQQPLREHPHYSAPRVPAAWRGRLWLAGTEFAPNLGGYLEGALAAADQAVEALLAANTAANSRPAP